MSKGIVTKEQQAAQGLGRRASPTASYVPASPERRTTPVAYPITEYPMTTPESHLAALQTIQERATPVDRAVGLGIRLIPFTVCWVLLAAVLAFVLDGDAVWPFVLFVVLTASTYWLMDRTEYQFSAGGIERHKANLAAELQAKKLDNDQELKRAALNSYIRQLGQK